MTVLRMSGATAAMSTAIMMVVCGCDARDKPRSSDPERNRVETTEAQASSAAETPSSGAAATQAASAPASQAASRPALPKLPAYLEILSTVHERIGARVDVVKAEEDVLSLTTENVARLRVLRNELPFTPGRSVIVRIDGQAIEWSVRGESVELTRGRTGAWTAASSSSTRPASAAANTGERAASQSSNRDGREDSTTPSDGATSRP